MSVEMSMALFTGLCDQLQETFGQLPHLWCITSHRNDEPALLPPFMVRQNRGIEKLFPRRRAAVNNVGVADILLLQAVELMERRRQNCKLGRLPALPRLYFGRDNGKLLQNAAGAVREAVVDDVDVLDRATPHHEGEADVPVGLHAAAKDGYRLDVVAAVDET